MMSQSDKRASAGPARWALPLALALVVRAGAEERLQSAGRSDSGDAAPELQVLRKVPEEHALRTGSAERCSSAAASAEAERLALTFDARTDIYSAYVWRGKALDKHAVMQPSAIATLDAKEAGSFSLKVWSNWDLTQHSGDSKATKTGGGINVLNLTPSYTKAIGPVGFTVGNIFYTFPGGGYPKHSKSTYELYTTLAYKNPVVTPSLSVYYDYRGVGGGFLEDNLLKDLYARAALDKSFRLSERVTAGGTVLLGGGTSHYTAVRYYSSDEGLADYQASVNVSYAITDGFSLGATLAYTGLIGGAWGLDRQNLSPDAIVWGGVNLRLVF
jgi:hypothetical protein